MKIRLFKILVDVVSLAQLSISVGIVKEGGFKDYRSLNEWCLLGNSRQYMEK